MPPDLTEELRANIRAEMGRQRLTLVELARRAGINRGTLWNQINGQSAITVTTLVAVADALGVERCTLLPDPTNDEATA